MLRELAMWLMLLYEAPKAPKEPDPGHRLRGCERSIPVRSTVLLPPAHRGEAPFETRCGDVDLMEVSGCYGVFVLRRCLGF